jgi:hypothetical protein
LLPLQDKLNTRDRLRRRRMELDSYSCENCTLQRQEAIYHLFIRCNFAQNCWASIGVIPPKIQCPQQAVSRIKRQLRVEFAMEIIIRMTWIIWKCRNGWIFENIAPTLEKCRFLLAQELNWLKFRLNQDLADKLSTWMQVKQL